MTLASFLDEASGVPQCGGHRLATTTWEALQRTRQRLAALLGVDDPRRVIFTASGTDALNLAIKGLLAPGDHVITSVMEHDAVRRPLRALEALGVTTTVIGADSTGAIDPDDVRRALRPNTRLVVIGHASNVTGVIQPLREISSLTRAQDTLLLVDAGQTAGAVPFTLEEIGADLVAVTGHKWLLGPPGTGALVLSSRVDPSDLAPLREGRTVSDGPDDVQPWTLPERYEAGTINTVGFAALGSALTFLEEQQVPRLAQRLRRLTSRLIDGLGAIPGVRIFGPPDTASRVPIVSCTIAGWNPQDAREILERTFGILCSAGLHGAPGACRTIGAFPLGTVRFSPGWCTTEDEVDRAIEAVTRIAQAPSRDD